MEPIRKEFGLEDTSNLVFWVHSFTLAYAVAGVPLGYLAIDPALPHHRRLTAWSLLTEARFAWSSFVLLDSSAGRRWRGELRASGKLVIEILSHRRAA